MSNWQERMQRTEDKMRELAERKMQEEGGRREEFLGLKRAEAEEALVLLEQVGVANELEGVNEQVWGNLGRIVHLENAIKLVCDYNTYSARFIEKTERKFGFYTTHLWEGGPQLSGYSAEPGPKKTHLGWRDVTRSEFAGWETHKQTTRLSVGCDYSQKTDCYHLFVRDSSVEIPLGYFPEYPPNSLGLRSWDRPVEDLYQRRKDLFYDERFHTKRSEEGYILCKLSSFDRGLSLLFPKSAFDYDKVHSFLVAAFSVSCLRRKDSRSLPADLIKDAEGKRGRD